MGGLDNGKYDREDWTREKVRAGLKDLIEAAGPKISDPRADHGRPGDQRIPDFTKRFPRSSENLILFISR